MIRKSSTALALATLLLAAAAPGALAHPIHASYQPAAYQGHWHGNTYYPVGTHWTGNLDAQLFVATANGDVSTVKRLVERGANVDARDVEGLAPLSWAAQYGRTDVASYLIQQHANLNPADKHGFTPLMWAAQEGHQTTVELLLNKGANAWVSNRSGVSAYTLARYSGSWRTASMLEAWLDGRNRMAAKPAKPVKKLAPTRVTVVRPVTRVAAAAPAVAPAAAAGEISLVAKAMAFKRLSETGAAFTDDFGQYVKTSTSGGFGLNTLAAATSPDMETGKLLTSFFANAAKSQDLRAARADLEKAKASLNGNMQARFARFVADADKALAEAGV